MADDSDRSSDENWGHDVAKWTFLFTIVLAALYVGAVFVFILN